MVRGAVQAAAAAAALVTCHTTVEYRTLRGGIGLGYEFTCLHIIVEVLSLYLRS
jgi:hypothetical protein